MFTHCDGRVLDIVCQLNAYQYFFTSTSTEFISYICAATISASFDFRDLVKGAGIDEYRFRSKHSSDHYALSCHDHLSNLASSMKLMHQG